MPRATHRTPLANCLLVAFAGAVYGAEPAVTPDKLVALHGLIRPQADESRWAKVAWETNLKDARERAAREDKPLLLWRSGGGDVLGRT